MVRSGKKCGFLGKLASVSAGCGRLWGFSQQAAGHKKAIPGIVVFKETLSFAILCEMTS